MNQSRERAVQLGSWRELCAGFGKADEEPPVQHMKAEPELQIKSPLIHPEERSLWCKTRSWNPFPSKTSGWTAELGEVMRVRNSARAHSYCGARDGRKTDSRMMPFMEIVFCGLATWIFPFSWYWEGWTRPALVGLSGTRGHHGRSLPVPSSTGSRFATPRLFGDPQEAAAPLPPMGLTGTLCEQQRALGIARCNSALSNFLGSFYWKLLQFSAWLEKMTAANPN